MKKQASTCGFLARSGATHSSKQQCESTVIFIHTLWCGIHLLIHSLQVLHENYLTYILFLRSFPVLRASCSLFASTHITCHGLDYADWSGEVVEEEVVPMCGVFWQATNLHTILQSREKSGKTKTVAWRETKLC